MSSGNLVVVTNKYTSRVALACLYKKAISKTQYSGHYVACQLLFVSAFHNLYQAKLRRQTDKVILIH